MVDCDLVVRERPWRLNARSGIITCAVEVRDLGGAESLPPNGCAVEVRDLGGAESLPPNELELVMTAFRPSVFACVLLGCAGTEQAAPAPAPEAEKAHVGKRDESDLRHETDDPRATEQELVSEDDEVPVGGLEASSKGEALGDVGTEESLDVASGRGRAPAEAPARMARKRSRTAPSSGAPPPGAPSAPALKAGRHDDNAQYNRFLEFLRENSTLAPYPIDVSERLVVKTLDARGRSIPNCNVTVRDLGGAVMSETRTFADGSTHFFPSEVAQSGDVDFTVRARCGNGVRNGQLSRRGRRVTELRFDFERPPARRVPVDIAVVLDTTGSMSSQIERLKTTLRAIHVQLTSLPSEPDVRFALVAYRDRGDEYITQTTQFTSDVDAFQAVLNRLEADGGGDTPEDLQSALDEAMNTLQWRKSAVRIGFIVADAVPHTDYNQAYTYRKAIGEALARGIKWVSVGAGGLPREGEVIFRQIAQYTMGEYVFVTEGGGGDTEGSRSEASHHVGTNYRTENLDQAIVRIVRRELSFLTENPRDFDSTIVATATGPVAREVAFAPAVKEALRQLIDYSSIRLDEATPVAVAPFTASPKKLGDVAEYVTDQMVLAASRDARVRLVDRDLEAVAQEVALQVSELFDPEKSVALGRMVGAELLIVGKISARKRGADVFARLVRVETGEVLSVAKVSLDQRVLSSS
ncbi:MAG: VWA domain-containing protein [Myxococcota bacterium]